MLMRLAWLGVGTVREQRVELQTLIARRLTAEFSKVPKLGRNGESVAEPRIEITVEPLKPETVVSFGV